MSRNALTALAVTAFALVVAIVGTLIFADAMQHRPKVTAGRDVEGSRVLKLKNGDTVSVDITGKARVNGIPVSCPATRKHVLSTMGKEAAAISDAKLVEMVPCRK